MLHTTHMQHMSITNLALYPNSGSTWGNICKRFVSITFQEHPLACIQPAHLRLNRVEVSSKPDIHFAISIQIVSNNRVDRCDLGFHRQGFERKASAIVPKDRALQIICFISQRFASNVSSKQSLVSFLAIIFVTEYLFFQSRKLRRNFLAGWKRITCWIQRGIPINNTFTLPVSDAQVAAYLVARPYNPATAAEQIAYQLWVNKFMNWWEAWADWRRTRLPNLVQINWPGNQTGGKIFEKLKYPNAEVAGNPNFGATASPNDYTTKVWWAGGPE